MGCSNSSCANAKGSNEKRQCTDNEAKCNNHKKEALPVGGKVNSSEGRDTKETKPVENNKETKANTVGEHEKKHSDEEFKRVEKNWENGEEVITIKEVKGGVMKEVRIVKTADGRETREEKITTFGDNVNFKECGNNEIQVNPPNHKNKNHNNQIIDNPDEEIHHQSSPPISTDSFIQEALARHNHHRKDHHVGDLQHNPELSAVAQKYAEHLAAIDSMQHSNCDWNGKSVGENLAMSWGSPLTGKKMTDMWYDEIKDYNFAKGDFSSNTGHFTQVVWKGSQQAGFGLAQSSNGTWYGVGNYYPPGNYMGQFQQNVMKK